LFSPLTSERTFLLMLDDAWYRVDVDVLPEVGRVTKVADGKPGWHAGYAMLICAAGDIHCAIDRLYQDVLAFEPSPGVGLDFVGFPFNSLNSLYYESIEIDLVSTTSVSVRFWTPAHTITRERRNTSHRVAFGALIGSQRTGQH
jgi:hypothetical protein